MGVTVTWDGLDTWIAHIASMRQSVPGKAKEIMTEIGDDAIENMASHTPVGKRATKDHEPGTLKRADTLTEIEGGFSLSNAAKSPRGAPYNKFIEEGTKRMRAQPYLAPATEFAKQAMEERLPQALEE